MKPNIRPKTVYYDYNKMCLVVDGVRIRPVCGEYNRNLTESHFVSIPNRDRSIEHLLMIISAMLVDYHYHRREEGVYDWYSCTYRLKTLDENPLESKAILFEAHECCRIVLERIFQGEWMSQTGYIGWVIYLMGDICDSLKDFNVYLTLGKELENMVSCF